MPLTATLVAALALTSASDDVWAQFSSQEALSRLNTKVEIGTADATPGAPVYWIRRTIQKPGRKIQRSQIDTRSCPRMFALLRSLRDLPMPHPNMPSLDEDQISVTADATSYSLKVSARYPGSIFGDLTVTAIDGSPLAAWVDDALATLDSCMPK